MLFKNELLTSVFILFFFLFELSGRKYSKSDAEKPIQLGSIPRYTTIDYTTDHSNV